MHRYTSTNMHSLYSLASEKRRGRQKRRLPTVQAGYNLVRADILILLLSWILAAC